MTDQKITNKLRDNLIDLVNLSVLDNLPKDARLNDRAKLILSCSIALSLDRIANALETQEERQLERWGDE